MNLTEKTVIALLKSGVTGERAEINADVNWKLIFSLGKEHKLIPLIYYGMINSELNIESKFIEAFEAETMKCVFREQNQFMFIEKLEKAFNERNIDFMPLKGVNIKKIYPKTEMRPMADIDVLIKMPQKETAFQIMRELGFDNPTESPHEYIYGNKKIDIELHKCIIPPYNKDFYSYFGDGWSLAVPDEGNKFKLEPNDEFIYLFTHFAKHYRDGGAGVLNLVDLWLYTKNVDIDIENIKKEIEKLGLSEFFENTLNLMKCWFEDGEEDKKCEFMTHRTFCYGCWGYIEKKDAVAAVKEIEAGNKKTMKLKVIAELLFPSAKSLSKHYPSVMRFKLLLPFYWIYHIFDAFFNRRNKFNEAKNTLKNTNEKNALEYKNELEFVGLNFDFKKKVKRKENK